MERVIQLDEQDVRVRMSADTLRVYRQTFGRDLLVDMIQMQETLDMEVIENLFYICAKAADPDLPELDEWLQGFSTFALYHGAKELMKLWREENQTTSRRKKKAGQ